jgi:flagellar basal-body rod protein FlgC
MILASASAKAEDSLFSSMYVSSQGMQAHSERLKVIAQNIANANTTGKTPGSAPYRRKVILMKNEYDEKFRADVLQVNKIALDRSDYLYRFEPNHPAADDNGYVKYPNVDINLEMIDAKEAQRSYEANLSAFEIAKSNQLKLLEALK